MLAALFAHPPSRLCQRVGSLASSASPASRFGTWHPPLPLAGPTSNLHLSVSIRGSLSDLLGAHHPRSSFAITVLQAEKPFGPFAQSLALAMYIARSSLRVTVAMVLHGHMTPHMASANSCSHHEPLRMYIFGFPPPPPLSHHGDR